MLRSALFHRLGTALLLAAFVMPAGLCLCGGPAEANPEPEMACHAGGSEAELSASCCCCLSELSSEGPQAAVPRPQGQPGGTALAALSYAPAQSALGVGRRLQPFDLRPPEAPPPAFSTPLRI